MLEAYFAKGNTARRLDVGNDKPRLKTTSGGTLGKSPTGMTGRPKGRKESTDKDEDVQRVEMEQPERGEKYGGKEESCSTSSSLKDMLSSYHMQNARIPTFKGESRGEYWDYMNSFKKYVGTSAAPDSEELQMLIHSCSSNIRNVLNPFTRMKSSEGYGKVLSTLKDRYGDEDAHIEELLINLINGPLVKITNGEGLQDLADEPQACICSFESMYSQETLEHLLVKKGIIERLPGRLQERYEIAVLDHPPKRYGHMKIRDTWKFIQSRAKEAKRAHTRYTSLRCEGKDRSSKQAITLVTNDVGERDCPLYHGPHQLPQCSNFRKLTKMGKRDPVK
ncbi:hypothetical protein Hamer_G007909 [Homarus americanus]|uniref:Uncharacterized protein n=1 Tax=Homarus americanus TaxID=6706 RepID=A0A8J5MSY5_HOMAM|nr:hypothetical protein Hamer_G007909 [Homarus americanus]